MRLGCWNVGGWALKDSDNKHFRERTMIYSDCDIFCVVETFLKNNETIVIPGYTYYSHNRTNIHKKAKRGSGGVGIFIRNELLKLFSVSILDDTVEDILWIKLSSLVNVRSDDIVLCVAYLPPSDSVRNNDPEAFYCSLVEQVYAYQNEGRLFICGDLNSRVGDESDYIEGVDEVRPRDILDFTCNSNGDLLINFLVDCGLCMLNGRIGVNEYTHVSHRGKSVVDYVLVPYEQLLRIDSFEIRLVTDIVNELNMQGNRKVPDHSLLVWTFSLSDTEREVIDLEDTQVRNKHVIRPSYNVSNMPPNFLSDADSVEAIEETILKIEHGLETEGSVSSAYESFLKLLNIEMDKHLPKKHSKKHPPNQSLVAINHTGHMNCSRLGT